MIDIRGNEEATWQELDRGDAKRTQKQRNKETKKKKGRWEERRNSL